MHYIIITNKHQYTYTHTYNTVHYKLQKIDVLTDKVHTQRVIYHLKYKRFKQGVHSDSIKPNSQ